ncbi:MAG TPA: ABC transporter permease [Candidatus Pelethomonas intestinigallinarum]|nr:ABC transporter permease [Candidatus Pelethomonas intestinigallinarum]
MTAVFRHELSSYFKSVSGYVFGAFLLLFAGIYTTDINLNAGLTNFEYVLDYMCIIFLIIVPILTMRVVAEERRQRTDQLLYSLPLTMTEVVLGKYGALLVVFLAPMAVIGVYPLILSAFGNVYLPAAYSAWLGFFLLGAALLAIGMFISSLTESQAVAAGLCFLVMLVNYFITSLAGFISTTAFASFASFTVVILALAGIVWFMTRSGLASGVLALVLEAVLLFFYAGDTSAFEGFFPEVMENLSLFDQFYQFVNGVFDLRAVVYLLSVSGLFLFLTVQSLEKRRWSE